MIMGAIYSILNKSNGKIYVGQTINPKNRRRGHFSQLRGNYHFNDHLQKSYNKYGEDSFEFNILEYCSDENLDKNEKWWISYFNSTNSDEGYNSESGGSSSYIVSNKTRNKIKSNRCDVHGKNNPMYGRHHSKSTKKKISDIKFESANTTGYFRVTKHKSPKYKQGFTWVYVYDENGKKKSLSSVNIHKLEEKVLANGLEWKTKEVRR